MRDFHNSHYNMFRISTYFRCYVSVDLWKKVKVDLHTWWICGKRL